MKERRGMKRKNPRASCSDPSEEGERKSTSLNLPLCG